MNKTRKAIIELIEHYMDKTLSEGCLVDIDGDDINIQKVGELDGDNAIINIYGSRWLLRYPKSKIIGHYDITAVDKYLFFEKNIYNIVKGNVKILFLGNKEIGNIPNKPLHLYTEQEEKELLELLLKLK